MADKIIVEYGVNNEGLVEGLNEVIDKNEQVQKTATASGKSFNSLVAELKNLKKELAGLDEGSAKFKEVAKRAGEVQDKIGDISTRVKTLASDTRKLDTVIQAATGIAAGFSIAQGAAGLFGNSNKELEKSLLKVQSAMAILNGLQEIQVLLQKQTAIGSKVAAVSQALYTTAVGSSTGALKLFRLALIGTGIGAIVVAVIALAQNFDKVKEVLAKVIPQSVQVAFTFLKDTLGSIYDGVKNFVGLGDEVKTNTTIYTAFGGALSNIQKPLKDIPKLQAEMNAKSKEQAEALKKLNDSGAPGSIGRYNFLLGEAKAALEKLVPGTKAYADALNNVEEIQNKINAAQEIANGANVAPPSPIIPIKEQEKQQEISTQSYQDYLKGLGVDSEKLKEAQVQQNKDAEEATIEANKAIKKEERDKKISEIKDEIQEKVEAAQLVADTLTGINNAVFSLEKANLDKQLRNKKISQEKYDKELKDIQTKNAKREKALNIFQSIINTAAAVVKMLANPGGPAGVALSIAAGITGAIQTAAIASQPIPQFAKGVIDLKGKGTGTSDSIHAMLSKGESVITAEKTARYKSELTALHNGNFEQMIYKNHVLPAVMRVKVELQNQLQSMMVKATLDDSRIVKALAKNKPNEFNYNRLASLINSGNKNRGWA